MNSKRTVTLTVTATGHFDSWQKSSHALAISVARAALADELQKGLDLSNWSLVEVFDLGGKPIDAPGLAATGVTVTGSTHQLTAVTVVAEVQVKTT